MDGYQRRTEKKKASISKAALTLFFAHGVEKVSIAEIAKKANVSPVTIYNYFGSKEDLIKVVIKEFIDSEMSSFEKLADMDITFPQKIKKILFDRNELTNSMATDFIKSITDPVIQHLIEEMTNTRAIPAMMKLIEQGRQEGYISPETSNEAIMLYFRIFEDAIQRPELIAYTNKQSIIELGHLFFYGLIGKPTEGET